MNKYVLVITPIKHIDGLYKKISKKFKILYFPNFKIQELNVIDDKIKSRVIAVLTNPNKSKVRIDQKLIRKLNSLKFIVTASTGTNHIDDTLLKKRNIKLISLTKDLNTIKKITSTSELAFAFTISAVRNIYKANISVKNGEWDYLPFVGKQLNELTIGIIGFGRLGKIYYKFVKAFRANILVYDPYIIKSNYKTVKFVSLNELALKCDVISLHVHHTKETENMISMNFLKLCKKALILINTSRGEIVDENEILKFLLKNDKSEYYTDVISNEIEGKRDSPIYKNRSKLKNIFITPHIGGMTVRAQQIAYNRVIDRLFEKEFKYK